MPRNADNRHKQTRQIQQEQLQQSAPSLAQKAANFAKASAKHVSNGMKSVTAQTKSNRLAICNSCPFKAGAEDNPTCNKCGCFLNIKTGWASESCPIGKWATGESSTSKKSGGCGCGKKKT
jgi:hypothetical protein